MYLIKFWGIEFFSKYVNPLSFKPEKRLYFGVKQCKTFWNSRGRLPWEIQILSFRSFFFHIHKNSLCERPTITKCAAKCDLNLRFYSWVTCSFFIEFGISPWMFFEQDVPVLCHQFIVGLYKKWIMKWVYWVFGIFHNLCLINKSYLTRTCFIGHLMHHQDLTVHWNTAFCLCAL